MNRYARRGDDPAQAGHWRAVRATGDPDRLADEARQIRRLIIGTIDAARAGHVGGDLSVTDILTALYFGVLNLDPEEPGRVDRDRFILSKGHCSAALYSTLARVGYFSADELPTFMADGSALNGHPNRNKVPGLETNTGPLGHGLSVGVGEALGLRLQGKPNRVFVVTGDGELQEGSNWEALMCAAHYRLDNLTLIVDRNRLQQGAHRGHSRLGSVAAAPGGLRLRGARSRRALHRRPAPRLDALYGA